METRQDIAPICDRCEEREATVVCQECGKGEWRRGQATGITYSTTLASLSPSSSRRWQGCCTLSGVLGTSSRCYWEDSQQPYSDAYVRPTGEMREGEMLEGEMREGERGRRDRG